MTIGETPRSEEEVPVPEKRPATPEEMAKIATNGEGETLETLEPKPAEVKEEEVLDYDAEKSNIEAKYAERREGMTEWLKKFEATGALAVPEVTKNIVIQGYDTEGTIKKLAEKANNKKKIVERYPEKAKDPNWQVTELEAKAVTIQDRIDGISKQREDAIQELKAKQDRIEKEKKQDLFSDLESI